MEIIQVSDRISDPRTQTALDLGRRIGEIERQARVLFAEHERLVGEFAALMNPNGSQPELAELPAATPAPATDQPTEGLTARIVAALDAEPLTTFRAADLATKLDEPTKVIAPTLAMLAKHERIVRVDVGLYQSKLANPPPVSGRRGRGNRRVAPE